MFPQTSSQSSILQAKVQCHSCTPQRHSLSIRDNGMSFATATTWFWNFILSITWPSLVLAFKQQGAFSWYAAWCCLLWALILLFVHETKGKTLEELDQVFTVPLGMHAAYGLRQIPYGIKIFVLSTGGGKNAKRMRGSATSCRKNLNDSRTTTHDMDSFYIVYSSEFLVEIVRGRFQLAVHDVARSRMFPHCPVFTGVDSWVINPGDGS
ncbi:uncharacterized protein F5891DRAFT_1171636 [Suillus fuscotomentosus]|uniref:Uncharacterized protein n=1 Tax=Suillus fuscotomentosus TaxID=1912939 RepID=A0AAD4EDL4_9AGAM|nr:uncharacterized protein F5891DRAFT_1171636 [Suillus fuscotomentosus]KAG1903003.1 hypothetical protein F5891DRAFT_1171636 [Suillus fuscotomentosus]